jgi:hypothetical protein
MLFVFGGFSVFVILMTNVLANSFDVFRLGKQMIRSLIEIGLYIAIYNGKCWAKFLVTVF